MGKTIARTAGRPAVFVEGLAALLLLAPVFILPWLNGGNDPRCVAVILGGTVPGLVIWAGLRIGTRKAPRLPQWLVAASLVLVAVSLAHFYSGAPPAPEARIAAHQQALVERWPGSFVRLGSEQRSLVWLGLALSLAAWVDLLRRQRGWLPLVLCAHGVNGALLAWIGWLAECGHGVFFDELVAKATGKPVGFFFHYSLAAAYYNTCLPGALLMAFGVPGGRAEDARARHPARLLLQRMLGRLAGGALLAGLLLALAANDALAGQVAGAVCGLFFLGTLLTSRLGDRGRRWMAWLFAGLAGVAILGGIAGLAWAVKDERVAFGRLRTLPAEPGGAPAIIDRGDLMLPSEHPQRQIYAFDRRLAWATAMAMIPEAGWFGSGPGSWQLLYPAWTADRFLLTFYLYVQFTHNDPLQYVIEWGWLGGLAWGVLLLGAMAHGARRTWKRWRQGELRSAGAHSEAAGTAGLGSILLHSLVDFPLQCPAALASALLCAALALSSASAWDFIFEGRDARK